MASSHIVTLEHDETVLATDYDTYSYACNNFSRVIFDIEDGAGDPISGGNGEVYISVFAGPKAVVNRVEASLLASINQFKAGTGYIDAADDKWLFAIDCGVHQLERGEELQVIVDGSGLTVANDAVQMSIYAEINTIEAPDPKIWVKRTDNSFLTEGTSEIYVFHSAMDAEAGTIEMTYGAETVSQVAHSLNALANIDSVGDVQITNMGLLYDGVPRDITVNSSVNDFKYVCLLDGEVEDDKLANSFTWMKNRLSSITPKEKRFLRNK